MAAWTKILLDGDVAGTPGTSIASLGAGTVKANGASTNYARADHAHGIITGSAASMVAVNAAAANAGTKAGVARIDHKHQVAVGSAGSLVAGLNRTANAAGTSNNLARIDHRHTLSIKMNSVATAGAKFQLYKAQGEILNTAPSIGTGRIYFNSVDNHLYTYVP